MNIKNKYIKNKRLMSMALVLLCILFTLALSSGHAYAGKEFLINEIEITGNYNIESDEILYLLDIKPGDTFNPIEISKGIKRLFMKGTFESITVQRDDEGLGRISVLIEEKEIIKNIIIKGTRKLKKKTIKAHLGIREKDMIKYGLLNATARKLQDVLLKRGYPDGNIKLKIKRYDDSKNIDLIVEVKEGAPLMVDSVQVIGKTFLPLKNILSQMKVRQGRVYDQVQLITDFKNIESYYNKRGYFEPDIGPYTYSDGLLVIGVIPGKKLIVKTIGNDSISEKALLRVIPFFEAEEFSDPLLNESVKRILEVYNNNSFPLARVAPVVVEDDNNIIVNFYIFEGKSSYIRELNIQGNTLPDEKIKALVKVKKATFYNPKRLLVDIKRIASFYIALGYKDVKIKHTVKHDPVKGVFIDIIIQEGNPVTIYDVKVSGTSKVSAPMVEDEIFIRGGDPYNEVDISDARRRAVKFCKNYGLFKCTVKIKRKFTEDGVYLDFVFNEGTEFFFGKTIISGNRHTKRKVITREISYKDGFKLTPSAIVKTKQRLYKLGLFSKIDIKPVNPESGVVDIALKLKEGKAGSVEFGFGYGEYELYRGFFGVSYRNLYGMNRTISFRTEQSTLWSRYIVNFIEPYLFGYALKSRTFVMHERRKEKNIDTDEISYRIDKNVFSTGVEKDLAKRFKLTLYYELSYVETYDVQSDVILSKEDTGTLLISSISPSVFFDTRDSTFDPSSGNLSGITLKVASESLASETNFIKATAQSSFYFPAAKWLVGAIAFRGGVADGFNESDNLPLVERFFLGGRNTVRGYIHDGLGPKGVNGTPIGGNSFLLANLEFRFKISKNWRIVPFIDIGNVWLNSNDVSLEEMKTTVGAGLQYNTPVGPLRFDYGRKLDKESGESSGQLHFSIGHAF